MPGLVLHPDGLQLPGDDMRNHRLPPRIVPDDMPAVGASPGWDGCGGRVLKGVVLDQLDPDGGDPRDFISASQDHLPQPVIHGFGNLRAEPEMELAAFLAQFSRPR